jgi:hypothetical protein
VAWAPTRIRRVDPPLETSTGATRVETDLGPAYAKFLGNPEGPQALFCELVGTRAAAWLGLPTLDIHVIDVPIDDLVEYANGSRSIAGPAFVSKAEQGTSWGGTADELAHIENPEALAGMIVLDTWLTNCDRFRPSADEVRRNTRNVFLRNGVAKGKFQVIAMDHTHCFTCGRELTKAVRHIDRIRDARLYGHFPELRGLVTHSAIDAFAARLQALQRPQVGGFLAEVPKAWQPAAEVMEALGDFLLQRAAFVGQNVNQMLVDDGFLEPRLALEG